MNEVKDQEQAFDEFIDGELYEKASDAIWELVKAAYKEGWEKGKESAKKQMFWIN